MSNKPFGHGIIMIAAHLAPLLLFVILPKIGISGQWTFVFAAVVMFGAHLWMMKWHSHNHSNKNKTKEGGSCH